MKRLVTSTALLALHSICSALSQAPWRPPEPPCPIPKPCATATNAEILSCVQAAADWIIQGSYTRNGANGVIHDAVALKGDPPLTPYTDRTGAYYAGTSCWKVLGLNGFVVHAYGLKDGGVFHFEEPERYRWQYK